MIADMILYNGFVYTVDACRSTAQAVAVKDDKIIFVGSSEGSLEYKGEYTQNIDMNGKMLLPSFFEGHCHSFEDIDRISSCNIRNLDTVDECLSTIKGYIAEHPDYTVIRGIGWKNALFTTVGPRKELLDDIRSDIPILLYSSDHHSAWVNTKALELAGITRDTPNPSGGGVIEHDDLGEPSGTVRESAIDIVEEALPDYSIEQYMQGIKHFQEKANSWGFTGAFEARLFFNRRNRIEAAKRLASAGELTMRFRAAYEIMPEHSVEDVGIFAEARERDDCGEFFQVNTIKFCQDGVVEGLTAQLLEPYSVDTQMGSEFKGEPKFEHEQFKSLVAECEKHGFQIHVHAIGDGATQYSLDAFAYGRQQNGAMDLRNAITHLQLVAPEDIIRFHDLDVIANVNTYWHYIEDSHFDIRIPYLGKERADKQFPLKSFIDAGAMIVTASDYGGTNPVKPQYAIEIGMTRRIPDGDLLHGSVSDRNDPKYKESLWPEEIADIEDLIASVTYNPAYANFLDKVTGSIEVGKSADMVLLDKNIFDIPATEISKAKVLMTIFKGKKVFQDVSFDM